MRAIEACINNKSQPIKTDWTKDGHDQGLATSNQIYLSKLLTMKLDFYAFKNAIDAFICL